MNGVCVISHGSSQSPSIFNAIRLAKEAVDNRVLEEIRTRVYSLHQEEMDFSNSLT